MEAALNRFCGLTEQSAWVWVEATWIRWKKPAVTAYCWQRRFTDMNFHVPLMHFPLTPTIHPLEAALAIIFVNPTENFSHFVFLFYRTAKLSLRVWKSLILTCCLCLFFPYCTLRTRWACLCGEDWISYILSRVCCPWCWNLLCCTEKLRATYWSTSALCEIGHNSWKYEEKVLRL